MCRGHHVIRCRCPHLCFKATLCVCQRVPYQLHIGRVWQSRRRGGHAATQDSLDKLARLWWMSCPGRSFDGKWRCSSTGAHSTPFSGTGLRSCGIHSSICAGTWLLRSLLSQSPLHHVCEGLGRWCSGLTRCSGLGSGVVFWPRLWPRPLLWPQRFSFQRFTLPPQFMPASRSSPLRFSKEPAAEEQGFLPCTLK